MSSADPQSAPGSFRPLRDRWGRFADLLERLNPPAFAIVDTRVARLHPTLVPALEQKSVAVLQLAAGEKAKTQATLERVCRAALTLPRSGTLVCVGGGTLGDLATVAAHVLKRGLRLVHVPSTLLAAVDSSVGGKGALHVGRPPIKNAIGVFHYAAEAWLCPELFGTLSTAQLREGKIEAYKMAASLDAALWKRWSREVPIEALIRSARALKAKVCTRDPYELEGHRRVLNFGHTFGHAVETLTRFRVSHGDAVGLGILCALDVGRALGITPDDVSAEIEERLAATGALDRTDLARALKGKLDALPAIVAADKKVERDGLRMVLVPKLGAHVFERVAPEIWRPLARQWAAGVRP